MPLKRNYRRCCFLATLAAATVARIPVCLVGAQDPTDQFQYLERYLDRLGLVELKIEFLESRVEQELDVPIRTDYIQRLSAEYVRRLLEISGNSADARKWLSKAERLRSLYPELGSSTLDIAMFHARYQLLLTEFEAWWFAGQPDSMRRDVAGKFAGLIDDLKQLNGRYARLYGDLVTRQQVTSDSSRVIVRQLTQAENVLLRSHYLLAWSSYLYAIIQQAERADGLQAAIWNFREFLQLDPGLRIIEVDENWVDFTSPWAVRAMTGLGMALQASLKGGDSGHIFRLIETHAAPLENDASLDIWLLKSHVLAGDDASARQFVNERAADISRAREQGSAFWIETARSGLAIRGRSPQIGARLIRLGLVGLTREMQGQAVAELIEQGEIDLRPEGFENQWIAGHVAFHRAQTENDDALLNTAGDRLRSAVEAAKAGTPASDVARCQFLRSWVLFLKKDFESAAPGFASVVGTLREIDRPLAARALWFRIQSLTEIGRRNPRRTAVALQAMEQMERYFPESRFTRELEFQKLRLAVANLPAGEALRRLNRIDPEDAHYADASFEKIQIRYAEASRQVDQRVESRLAEIDGLSQAVEEFNRLEVANRSQQLKANLLLADVRLRDGAKPAQPEIRKALDRASDHCRAANSAPMALIQEYRYYEFLCAVQFESERADSAARWLIENARDSRFERAALIHLARKLDERASNSPDQRAEVLGIYSRLSEVLGRSPQELERSSNARFAMLRLAELQAEAGDPQAARQLFEQLNNLFPKRQRYLIGLARVETALENSGTAIGLWSEISRAVPAGDESWYEAKANLVQLVAVTDPDRAKQLVRQTMNLSPNMPNPWKTRFEALTRDLGVSIQ